MQITEKSNRLTSWSALSKLVMLGCTMASLGVAYYTYDSSKELNVWKQRAIDYSPELSDGGRNILLKTTDTNPAPAKEVEIRPSFVLKVSSDSERGEWIMVSEQPRFALEGGVAVPIPDWESTVCKSVFIQNSCSDDRDIYQIAVRYKVNGVLSDVKYLDVKQF